jgi:hypothetical protein
MKYGQAIAVGTGLLLLVSFSEAVAQQLPHAPVQQAERNQEHGSSGHGPSVAPPHVDADRDRGKDERKAEKKREWLPIADIWAQGFMALAALLQVGLTGLGIVYIRRTLLATEAAVVEAREATEAANQAVAVTRVSAENQLRAYLTVDQIYVADMVEGQALEAWFSLSNRGQTPAKKITVRECAIRAIGVELSEAKIKFQPARRLYDLGPGQHTTVSNPLTMHVLTKAQIADIKRGGAKFILAVYISYEDVFGKLRRYTFRCNLDEDSFKRGRSDVGFHLTLGHKGIRAS